MPSFLRYCLFFAAVFVLLPRSASAQDAQKAKKDAKAKPAAKVEPEVTDPVVETLLEMTDPEKASPEEMVEAVRLLVDLKHVPFARRFVVKLAGAKIPDEKLAELARQFGTSTFFKMSSQAELNPEARAFADRVLDASVRVHRDPKRLVSLIEKLKSPSVQERGSATAELAYGADAAVNALLAVLADAKRADEHANVTSALVGIGSHAVEPLLGALETNDPALRSQVMEVLLQLDVREALPYFIAPALSPKSDARVRQAAGAGLSYWLGAIPTWPQAHNILAKEARRYYEGAEVKLPDLEGNVPLWHWDAAKRQAVQRIYAAADAPLAVAMRLSADWLELDPKNREAKRIYLASLLQLVAYQRGLDKPFPAADTASKAAAAFGVAPLQDVLVSAMSDGHAPAATSAAVILGEIGDEGLLQGPNGQPTPLVQAAVHPDRRLRLAAVEAIAKLKPKKPFAGSHHVPQALAYFASTTGSPKALVADSHVQEAQRMAGLLVELGYDTEVVSSARQLANRAAASPDFAFAMFNVELPYSDPDQLVQRVRHDPRAALLPLGLINPGDEEQVSQPRVREFPNERAKRTAEGHNETAVKERPLSLTESYLRVERLTKKHRYTTVVVRTRDVKHMAAQVKALLDTMGRDFVTRAERTQQAKRALTLLVQLTAEKKSLYDFKPYEEMLEPAVFVPELSPLSSDVLANLGTPFSQRTLVNVASTSTLPIEARQAAAQAFRRSYERHGILLTRQEILRQYDRYNASEFADAPTQEVLGSILNTIELPRKKTTDEAQPRFEKRKDAKGAKPQSNGAGKR